MEPPSPEREKSRADAIAALEELVDTLKTSISESNAKGDHRNTVAASTSLRHCLKDLAQLHGVYEDECPPVIIPPIAEQPEFLALLQNLLSAVCNDCKGRALDVL